MLISIDPCPEFVALTIEALSCSIYIYDNNVLFIFIFIHFYFVIFCQTGFPSYNVHDQNGHGKSNFSKPSARVEIS